MIFSGRAGLYPRISHLRRTETMSQLAIAETRHSFGEATMTADALLQQPSTTRISAGRTLSAVAVLFLTFDASMKVMQQPMAVEGTVQLGYPAGVLLPLGIIQVVCLAIYLFPRTSILGAILWTGYLGGAIATHVRLENPLFTHILFPTYVAALIWGSLYLRDARVRALLVPSQARA